jgi:hypothetical protein
MLDVSPTDSIDVCLFFLCFGVHCGRQYCRGLIHLSKIPIICLNRIYQPGTREPWAALFCGTIYLDTKIITWATGGYSARYRITVWYSAGCHITVWYSAGCHIFPVV